MENTKQTLRAENLNAAEAVFIYLQVNKELRAHEVNEIICAERGWNAYEVTLSYNFRTIKQFLKDHGLAKKVVVNTNHVIFVATEKTLNARSFESAIAETMEERVEAFKQRYAKEPETFAQLGAQVFNEPETSERTPIGVTPLNIFREQLYIDAMPQRLEDLKRAIMAYVEKNLHVPQAWVDEYENLAEQIRLMK
jgi:hypothetical protein